MSDSSDDMLDINDFIYSLATKNQPQLEHSEFKNEIRKHWSYEQYDNDEVFDLYLQYKHERNNFCNIATRYLHNYIENNNIASNKTLSQLFQLASFRDRKYLVNQEEIYSHYLEKKHQEAAHPRPSLVNQPIPKPPPPPKPTLDLNPAKQFIYDNLISNNHKLLTQDEFTTFCLNNLRNYGSKISQLFTYYKREYNRFHRHDPVIPSTNPETSLIYPFRSKIDDYVEGQKKGYFLPDVKFNYEPSDKQPKKLKNELSRPSFAPYPFSWEIDHLQFNKSTITYLFCLNINTRYLYVIPVNNKSAQETRKAIETLINKERDNFNHPVNNIRGDGDKGFESIKNYFPHINFYFTSSKFTYHNKLIDAVMRTLRNALNNDSLWDGHHDDIIQQLVYYYNFTTHRAIKMRPIDLHTNIDKEWEYIRHKTEELNDVKLKQYQEGLYNYKPGDRLRIHFEYSKTNQLFDKRRRQFDKEGTFIEYVNGNCKIELDNGSIVEVPIYFTIKK